jgi:hypothetical protein
MARSYAYRWGEEGIGRICDARQRLGFSVAPQNEHDEQLKERLFGLTNGKGNHGEDVKEQYYYLDNTPTHSYARMLYKYPQAAFPYEHLRQESARRTRHDPEFELLDTGIFEENRYFDVFIEYAKAGPGVGASPRPLSSTKRGSHCGAVSYWLLAASFLPERAGSQQLKAISYR